MNTHVLGLIAGVVVLGFSFTILDLFPLNFIPAMIGGWLIGYNAAALYHS